MSRFLGTVVWARVSRTAGSTERMLEWLTRSADRRPGQVRYWEATILSCRLELVVGVPAGVPCGDGACEWNLPGLGDSVVQCGICGRTRLGPPGRPARFRPRFEQALRDARVTFPIVH